MSRFKIGDKVIINPTSIYAKGNKLYSYSQLPEGVVGQIRERDCMEWLVDWKIKKIHYANSYNSWDLLPYIPKKWKIFVTKENYRILHYWRTVKIFDPESLIGGYMVNERYSVKGFWSRKEENFEEYEEISFDFFERFILNENKTETMSEIASQKKIIGYTIKKGFEKYLIPAAKIGNTSAARFEENQAVYGWMFANNTSCHDLLKDGDLVNEWFEPVYDEPEKPKSVTMVVGEPARTIKVFKDRVDIKHIPRSYPFSELEKLCNHFQRLEIQISEHKTGVRVSRVQFGCIEDGTDLTLKELEKVIDTMKSLK